MKERLNQVVRSVMWYRRNCGKPDTIERFLFTLMDNMEMFFRPVITRVSVGDVVDVNYGMNLQGEINGGHVPAIVLDQEGDMLRLVVLRNDQYLEKFPSPKMDLQTPENIYYYDQWYIDDGPTTVMLRSCQWRNRARVTKKIGTVSEEALKVIRQMLPTVSNVRKDP